MRRANYLGIIIGLFGACSIAAFTSRGSNPAQPKPGKTMPSKGTSLRIELGLKDTESTGWAGGINVSEGTVLEISSTTPGISIDGVRWKGKSQETKKKKKQKDGQVRPVVLNATIDAPKTTRVDVSTRQGEFSFRLEEIPGDDGKTFLEGQARVLRSPLSIEIVGDKSDDDFPAAAAAADGSVWVAYVAYEHGNEIDLPENGEIPKNWSSLVTKGHGDQIRLMRLQGQTWSQPMNVSDAKLDVWRPAVAAHGNGVAVVWSQKVGDEWDLHVRTYDAATQMWSRIERIERPGTDINPALASSPDGKTTWLAWQGWSGDNFNIYAKKLGDSQKPQAIGESPANEWNPSVAMDSKGTLHIAFDTYEAGNYDVRLASISTRRVELRAVAATPRFEARASVAVDKQDRVWVAYEEAGANWGKDFGSKWTGPSGVPFYLDRQIAVRVLADDEVQQPKGEVGAAGTATRYGNGQRTRISMPRIAADADGRIWLAYRRHAKPDGSGEVWASYVTHHSANGWTDPVLVPNSTNLLDNRPALVRHNSSLIAVYSTDSRTNNTANAEDNDLHAVLLQSETSGESPLVAVPPAPDGDKSDPVHPDETADVERMNKFRLKLGGKTYQLLRGEFHRHTEMTSHRDQDGPFEEIWRYGLDAARMDWIGPGDHDNGQREYTWWLTQKQCDFYHHAPKFMPMYTYERSVVYPSGHRNVVFARRGIRPLPRIGGGQERLMGTPEEGSPDIKRFYAYLKHFGGICSSHTSATNMGTDWRDNDPDVEPVVEIYQGHRQNYEHDGAPQSAENANDSIGGYQPAGFVWNALKRGYRLGFQVSSDHVSTHLSYAVVLVEKPTREGIVDAFKKRHSYGAQDNIVLVVKSGDHLMGDEFTVKAPPTFEIEAIGTGPIARVAIVRGVGDQVPTYVYNATPNKAQVSIKWTDDKAVAGETSYYYVRIEQEDKKLAWASPMWVWYEK